MSSGAGAPAGVYSGTAQGAHDGRRGDRSVLKSIWRAAAALAGGSMLAQALSAGAAPLLTRVYSPAELGMFALYSTFVGFGSVLAALKLELAIVSANKPRHVDGITATGLQVVVVMAPLFGVLFAILCAAGVGAFGELPLSWAVLATIAVAGSGVLLVCRYSLVQRARYSAINSATVVQSALGNASRIALGVAGFGPLGLVLGDLIGRVAGGQRSLAAVRSLVTKPLWHRPGRSVAFLAAYRVYPRIALPSSVLDTIALALPLPLIATVYGGEAAGYYALVEGLFGVPAALIGRNVADVLHTHLQNGNREGSRRLLLTTAAALAGIAAVPAGVLALRGPEIFSFVFGPDWTPAGTFAALMSPWLVTTLAVSPLSRLVYVAGAQRQKLQYDVLSVAAVIGSIVGAGATGTGAATAVGVLSAAKVATYVVWFLILIRIAGRSLPKVRPPRV